MVKKGYYGNEGFALGWDRIKVRQVASFYTTNVASLCNIAKENLSKISMKTCGLETRSSKESSVKRNLRRSGQILIVLLMLIIYK